MALAPGTRVGSCEVVGPLGSGGMGDVYRGRDQKLNREVAIKTLPDAFAHDPERLSRFEREAQILGALNHPHIAQVYGVSDDPPALIMELVPGESLAQRLTGGAVPVREALAICRQVARALEAAHEKGIVHRDLKPGNIMLTPDGQVKVLDFGLARIAEKEADSNPSQSPTLTFTATRMGVILGTAAYMSPEQAKGRVADKRSDVWAFGCVLYELLTGTRAFGGEDISDTLAAVLRGEPDWTQLPRDTPPRVAQLLRRLLEKDRGQRIPDMSVARYEIDDSLSGATTSTVVHDVPRGGRIWRAVYVIAGLLVGAAGAAALLTLGTSPAVPPRALRFDVRPPAGAQIISRNSGAAVALVLSPDGTQVAYRVRTEDGGDGLAVRRLDGAESTMIPVAGAGSSPAFSPDGRSLAYFNDGKVHVLTLGTSVPVVACAVDAVAGLDWIDDQTLVFAGRDGLYKVARIGGTPEPIVSDAAKAFRYPEVTPGGRVLLYTMDDGSERRIVARSLASGEQKVVIENASFPKFLASGHLVFMLGGRLAAAPFDPSALRLAGTPVPLDETVVERITGNANFDVSSEGTFVSLSGNSMYSSRFTWFNRSGVIVGRIGNEDLPYPRYPRLSPDGTRFAATVGPGVRGNIWVFDLAGAAQPLRLTSGEHNVWPTWTVDGKSLIFGRLMTGSNPSADRARQVLMTIAADGSTLEPRTLVPIANPSAALATVSPDGRWMLYTSVRSGSGADLMLKSLTETGDPHPWIADPFNESEPAFSPDGQSVAYTSTQTGSTEVWVRPFPGPGAPIRISPNGGREPVWARGGKELFYQTQGKLMAAPVVAPAPSIRFGLPTMLFEGQFVRADDGTPRTYDVARDGRFLMIENKPNPTPTLLNVVAGWGELLKTKAR